MKIEANNSDIVLKEVYSGVSLVTDDRETFGICMRDSGFEFTYGGEQYEAKNGKIRKLSNNLSDVYVDTDKAFDALNR